MRTPTRTPWLSRVLARVLPDTASGRSILGDVLEEHDARSPGLGRSIWLAGVVLTIGARYLPARLAGGRSGWRARTLLDDLIAGFRALRRDRSTVLMAVMTLAIGMGSVTAILSAVYGSLLKPLPFRDPASLVVVGDRSTTMAADRIAGNLGLSNARDLGRTTEALAGLAAYRDLSPTISGAGDARQVRAQEVDAPFFDVLGTVPVAGRLFAAADQEPGAAGVAMLSAHLATQLFTGAHEAIGRSIRVDGGDHTVVGVVPAVTQLGNPQLWLPFRPNANVLRRNSRQVFAVARLRPGGSIDAARAELTTRFDALKQQYPEIGEARSVGAVPIYEWIVGERGPRLLRLLGLAVAAVLVIAACNVAGLLLLRAERRQVDLAVRAALGATRTRLTRQLAVEGVSIAVLAATVGLVFASWCVSLLVELYGSVLPRAWEIGLHPPVVAATGVLAALVGVVISLVPALRLGRHAPGVRMMNVRGTTRASFGQRALVWSQTAVAMVVLALAGLVVNSVWRLSSHDLGVDDEGVLVFDVSVAGRRGEDATARFFEDLTARLSALPGVRAAAAASRRPLFGGNNTGLSVPGVPETVTRDAILEIRAVTADYFELLGIDQRSGRSFEAADRTGPPVVVVNRTFEQTFFGDGSALGRQVQPSGQPRLYEIVGVVDDVREFGPTGAPRPTAYWPHGNGPYFTSTWMTTLVKTGGDPLSLVPAARAVLRDLDAEVALESPVTLASLVANQVGRDRLAVRALLTLAGAMSLALAVVGLYSVLSYAITRRTREIGIRRALGATRSGVVRLLLLQGFGLAVPGVVAGVVAAGAGGQLVAGYLYGVTPADPLTLAAGTALILSSVLAASALPAWRGGRIEPVDALRRE